MTAPPWDGSAPYGGPPQYGPPQYGPPQYGPPQYGPPQYGPPQYGPPQYGPPAHGQSAYGQSPYGAPAPPPWGPQPGWGWPAVPQQPQRPGPVIAAAVLVFASALLVVVGTVYAMAFSALLSLARGPDAGMGPLSACLHLLLAGLLVVGGLRVLAHDRRWLLGAVAAQVALAGYWGSVLDDVAPSTLGDGVLTVPVVYAVLALVAGGLTFLPDARAWTGRPPAGG